MANITKQQVLDVNKKCSNGWIMDVSFFLTHNEKTLVKDIKLSETEILRAKLWFTEVREGYHYTGLIVPQLHLSLYKTSADSIFMTSHGLGNFVAIKDCEQVKRRNLKVLQTLTERFTDDELIKIYNEKTKEV